MTTNVLELKDVTKVFGGGEIVALDRVSLGVPEGSLFGFVGLNGAGKTTTIRIIAGMSTMNSGEMFFLGRPFRSHERAAKRLFGFVLDEPLYFDWMTAREYLRFAAVMYELSLREAVARTEDLLDFLDLSARADDPISTYSTGMRKKVSLASAIIHKPKVVVLDEPLEGIDALTSSAIKKALRHIAHSGSTILITSHNLDTLERLCDHVGIIHQGKVILECTMAELLERASSLPAAGAADSLEEIFLKLVGAPETVHLPPWL
jgi:ABC-2 type transport system ATP-binding protein